MTFREGSSNVASASRSETSAFRDESSVGHTLNRLCILVIITLIPAIAHNRVEHNYRAITVLSFQAIAAGLAFCLLIALAVVALWVAERNGLLAADPRQFVGYPFLIDVGLILFITAAAS